MQASGEDGAKIEFKEDGPGLVEGGVSLAEGGVGLTEKGASLEEPSQRPGSERPGLGVARWDKGEEPCQRGDNLVLHQPVPCPAHSVPTPNGESLCPS